MDDGAIQLWLVVAAIAGAFVLAMLGVLSRWVADDNAERALRTEVRRLREEYVRRTRELEVVEAEQQRVDAMTEDESRKVAA